MKNLVSVRDIGRACTLLTAMAIGGCSPRLSAPAAHRLLDELFAPPTEAERAAVLAEWRAPEVRPEKVRVEWERREENGRRTLVLSHEVDGQRHYGAVRVPPGGPGRRLPVLVVAHGGQMGASGYHFSHRGPFATGWIQVVPSFRSERLFLTPFRIYRSEGISDPWSGDVEDSMALLGAALALLPEADSSRVAVTGHSRGGAVALLMGIRDPRVKAVATFAAPTDLFLPEVRRIAGVGLRMPLPPMPGADFLMDSVLLAYRDGRIPLERARLELLRRSPAWFVDELPPTQMHHGILDGTVPYAHGERARLRASLSPAAVVEFHGYPGGRHRARTLRGATERAERFLSRAVLERASR